MNWHETFIVRALRTIEHYQEELTDWERDFYASVRSQDPTTLSSKQFNRLQEIADRLNHKHHKVGGHHDD
jgi:hypothetical protein